MLSRALVRIACPVRMAPSKMAFTLTKPRVSMGTVRDGPPCPRFGCSGQSGFYQGPLGYGTRRGEWLRQFQHCRSRIGQKRLDIGCSRPQQRHHSTGRPIPDPQIVGEGSSLASAEGDPR